MKFLGFFLIFLSVLTSVHLYIGWRIITPSGFSPFWKRTFWILIIISMLIILFTFLSQRTLLPSGYKTILAWTGFSLFGFFSVVMVFLLIRDISAAFLEGFNRIYMFASGNNSLLPDPGRRYLLMRMMSIFILCGSGVICALGMFSVRKSISVAQVTVPVKDLPGNMENLRIIQITDLHAGVIIKKEFIRKITEKISDLNPDILVVTGDLFEGRPEMAEKILDPLAELHPRLGKYFVTGNHEYYSGISGCLKVVDKLGFITLNNEHRILETGSGRILIAGVTDLRGGDFYKEHESSPGRAIKGALDSDVKILLAHQPASVFSAAGFGFHLQLSGHTHGGQYFPWNLLIHLIQPFVAGLYKHEDTWLYVSRGTGFWGPPMRLGAPAEITLIKLKGV